MWNQASCFSPIFKIFTLGAVFTMSSVSLLISHPISLALILMLNCLFISFFVSKLTYSWLLYILVLVFLGGVMIAVTYMTSLAANEKLFLPNLAPWGLLIFTPALSLLDEQNIFGFNSSEMFPKSLFEPSFSSPLLFCFILLFLTLVMVIKMLSVESGPLVKRLLTSNLN